jgi:molecular chaperone IbpA
MTTYRRTKDNFLLNPFSVGFDELFKLVNQTNPSYPPYNIVKASDTEYTIELAVAGFSEDELEVTLDGNKLSVIGKVISNRETEKFLYRGIANRNFTHNFTIADNVEVSDVSLVDGMLVISLVRNVPEEEKPKKFSITNKREFLAE